MIIRPACGRSYTALPNAIWNDRRLSADTRAMVALVLSKPSNWQLRPVPLARALSREGAKPIGRAKLARMFQEAMSAGYMARSAEQGRQDDGAFGRYAYFLGMPDDVTAAVASSGVAILPQSDQPHTAEPHTANRHRNHKVMTLQTTDSKKPPPTSPAEQAETLQGLPKEANPTLFGEMIGPACRAKRRLERVEVIQDRIAKRLGSRGWTILLALTSSELDQLTARERVGTLDNDTLAMLHARFPAPSRKAG